MSCSACGRENDPTSKFCIDCGKPLTRSGAVDAALAETLGGIQHRNPQVRFGVPATNVSASPKVGPPLAHPPLIPVPPAPVIPPLSSMQLGTAPCPTCRHPIDLAMPFCPSCGGRVATPAVGSAPVSVGRTGSGPTLSVLDGLGGVTHTERLPFPESTLGRSDGELRFPDDAFISPVHAEFSLRDNHLYVRDLGSRNGTWVYIDEPYKLQDGDTVLVGSQLLRFRRLGYPGPQPAEADATRRLGSSTPSADIAMMQQIRADGSARDNCHLSPSRNVVIGRAEGDWLFPYDGTMSGRHAEVRNEDLEFIVIDLGSRNGIAIAVRGEREVRPGQRVMIGNQTLRIESL